MTNVVLVYFQLSRFIPCQGLNMRKNKHLISINILLLIINLTWNQKHFDGYGGRERPSLPNPRRPRRSCQFKSFVFPSHADRLHACKTGYEFTLANEFAHHRFKNLWCSIHRWATTLNSSATKNHKWMYLNMVV